MASCLHAHGETAPYSTTFPPKAAPETEFMSAKTWCSPEKSALFKGFEHQYRSALILWSAARPVIRPTQLKTRTRPPLLSTYQPYNYYTKKKRQPSIELKDEMKRCDNYSYAAGYISHQRDRHRQIRHTSRRRQVRQRGCPSTRSACALLVASSSSTSIDMDKRRVRTWKKELRAPENAPASPITSGTARTHRARASSRSNQILEDESPRNLRRDAPSGRSAPEDIAPT